jgi:hypothetical protein
MTIALALAEESRLLARSQASATWSIFLHWHFFLYEKRPATNDVTNENGQCVANARISVVCCKRKNKERAGEQKCSERKE